MQCWNEALQSIKTSHVTCNSQSECFILALHSCAVLKKFYDIDSTTLYLQKALDRLLENYDEIIVLSSLNL